MPTDDTKQPVTTPPIIFAEDALPPMPHVSEQTTDDRLHVAPEQNSSSVAPNQDIVMPAVVTSGPNTTNLDQPKKKFAGGKIIATILGLFLLVGGVGAGVYLTGQDQNIAEKAANGCKPGDCNGCGSPKKRQECEGTKIVKNGDPLSNGVVCSTSDPNAVCYDSNTDSENGGATRCQILSFCKNSGCAQEYAGECGGEITTTTDTASCKDVKAYNSTWVELTAAQMSALKTGDIINFCVTGTTTGGIFTKAMFTINGVLQSETTMQRPASTDFCQTYTIPAGVTSFNVTADIFHKVLGWR